jgi:hypothetical protein
MTSKGFSRNCPHGTYKPKRVKITSFFHQIPVEKEKGEKQSLLSLSFLKTRR